MTEEGDRVTTTESVTAAETITTVESTTTEAITTTTLATEDILMRLKPMKYIEFTCTVCQTRVAKTFSKHSYEKGTVIIRCDGCRNLHLIADNLGFTGFAERNVEDIAANRGETVTTKWEGELMDVTVKPAKKT